MAKHTAVVPVNDAQAFADLGELGRQRFFGDRGFFQEGAGRLVGVEKAQHPVAHALVQVLVGQPEPAVARLLGQRPLEPLQHLHFHGCVHRFPLPPIAARR